MEIQLNFPIPALVSLVSVLLSCDSLYSPVTPIWGTAVFVLRPHFSARSKSWWFYSLFSFWLVFRTKWWLASFLHDSLETGSLLLFIIFFLQVLTCFVRFIERYFIIYVLNLLKILFNFEYRKTITLLNSQANSNNLFINYLGLFFVNNHIICEWLPKRDM